LTRTEKRIGQVLLAAPTTGLRSTTAIAEAAGASPASVLRFIAKIGFDGLPSFREALDRDLNRRARSPFDLYAPGAEPSVPLLEEILRAQVHLITETVGRLTQQALDDVRSVLTSSSQVWIMGGRFSQSVAHYLFAHLQLLRSGVRLLNAAVAPLADQLVDARRGICLVVFDFRRHQSDAEVAARFVKGRRGKVLVVTDPYLSPAARYGDHVLIASVERPALLDSQTAATALVDIIVSDLMAHQPDVNRARLAEIERARDSFAAVGP
jgi:DNA-binding MurR/RpiR family transcriptional regulator